MDALYRRHAPKVYAWCISQLKIPAEGEDATMEIFEKLPQLLIRYRIRHFSSWLYIVCRNHCALRLRELHRRQTQPLTELNDVACDPAGQKIAYEAYRDLLEEGIQLLGQAQRECLIRFFYQRQSYREIAQALHTHPKAVKSHLQNGKRNLRIFLSQFDPADHE